MNNSNFNLSRFVEAQNPVLDTVLQELKQGRKQTHWIFGGVDAMKFYSCLTLFALVAPENELFKTALERFYNGEMDVVTERLL